MDPEAAHDTGETGRSETIQVVAIWNPASGSAPEEAELRQALGPNVELIPTTEDDPGPGQASRAVEAGAAIAVVCGGDGTIRACLDALAGTETALDVVPLGTGNLLAANLGIPSGLEAARSIGRGPRRAIDLGRADGEAFAVMAGSGFDALMMRDAEEENKSRLGVAAYVKASLGHLRRRLERTTVIVDGEVWYRGPTALVLVGNQGTISGGIEIFADADPADGRLDVAVLAPRRLRDWAGVAVQVLRGRPESSNLIELTQGEDITVITDRPRPWELDGEPRPPTDVIHFTVDASALLVHDRRDHERA